MSISTRVACNGKGRNENKEAYLFVIFILTIILFCILIVGCKKEELPEKLPELTIVGANTFGCMINNEIYIPEHRKVTFALNPIIIEYPIPPEYYFAVYTNRITNNSDTINNAAISFNANNINKPGRYVINYGKVKYNGAYYNNSSVITSVNI
ncbi:hypothetical protein [Williamwhitmania taraxaci]|uniref:Uncharacterized protein n=1 Tax=Williamwhitmania taraxaci TaxID=1640674 RepID=A0A1G6Q0T6_9BACT|nr:hypothetical protein [Williamwhitmania taraxaci]SDC85534.1 hypothetical protein SAMN05216323_105621 [Williamwhitmania taraxaci]